MSYSNSFPTQRPTLNLDFANSGKLDSRISYSRSSTGTALSSERHLSSENLLLQSQDFDTSWSRDASLNAPTGSQTAPDGTSTAWLLTTAASGTGMPFLFQNTAGAVANNTVCTYVMHIKAGTASHAYISFRGQSSSAAAWALIDFASPTSPTTGGSLSSISATSVSLGNSWYRVALTFDTGTISSGYPYVYVGASDGTSPDSTGRVTWTYSGETIFAWGAQLSSTNSKVYDSPTTTQIHREYAPTLKTSAADEPRFEYTTDGESKGLLIEAQKTNLAIYSNDFTNAAWNKQSVTVTPSAAIGPDGQLSASLIAENTDTTTIHFMLPTAAITSGYSVGTDKSTHSVFAKYAGRNLRMTDGYNPVDGGSTIFDLQNGTVVSGGGSIQSCGNGWYRCSVTMTMSASTLLLPYIQLVDNTTWPNASDAGDGYSGVLIYGCQTEQKSMSSYITTGSSTVTRAADSCSVATADFGYTGGPVSVVSETSGGSGSFPGCWVIKNSTGSELLQLYKQSAASTEATDFRVYATSGGANTVDTLINSSASAGKIAVSYRVNDVAFTASGNAVQTDTSASAIGAVDSLIIGGITTSNQLNGHVKRLALFNVAISDTELAALTS